MLCPGIFIFSLTEYQTHNQILYDPGPISELLSIIRQVYVHLSLYQCVSITRWPESHYSLCPHVRCNSPITTTGSWSVVSQYIYGSHNPPTTLASVVTHSPHILVSHYWVCFILIRPWSVTLCVFCISTIMATLTAKPMFGQYMSPTLTKSVLSYYTSRY